MRSSAAARVLLALGFLAAPIAYGSWIANQTVFDPSATRGAAQALLSSATVRTTLARELDQALVPRLGGAAKLDKAQEAKVHAAIDATVSDPRFTDAFATAIASIDAHLLDNRPGRITIDTHAVTASLHDALMRIDPAIAPHATAARPVEIALGSKDLPQLGAAHRSLVTIGTLATLLATLFIGGALLLAHDRKTIGRVGRRTAFLALPPALMFGAFPRLLATRGGAAQLATAVLDAYGKHVLPSAAALAATGLGVWLVTVALPRARRGAPSPQRTVTTPALPSLYARATAPRASGDPAPAPEPDKLYL